MNHAVEWREQRGKTVLSRDEVHLWLVSVEAMETQLDELWYILSDKEKHRAKRFHFEKDQKRFIVARGMLRRILSQYSEDEPDEHQFDYNRYGKPYLTNNRSLCFNLSHSGDRVLYGVTKNRDLGVDIEYIKPFENAQQIVERYFSTYEKDQFRNLPAYLKNIAFYTCWTRKEAYIKAQGKGMSLPLDTFSVSLFPGMPASLLETHHDLQEKGRWTLQEVMVGEEYIAATAVTGHDLYFKSQEWAL